MTTDFNRGAVHPVECLVSGFALVKGQYWLFLGVAFLAMLIGGAVPFGILLGPMMCGLYLCFFAKMRGEHVKFELLFRGFEYFSKSVWAGIVQTLPMMILMVVAYIPMMAIFMVTQAAQRGQPKGAVLGGVFAGMFLFMFLAIMVGSLISLLFSFSYPLIVERQMPAGEALKTSVRAVMGNAGGMLGLFLLNALISIIAVPFCCVGVYFVLPISMASYAMAYRSMFPEVNGPPLMAEHVLPNQGIA